MKIEMQLIRAGITQGNINGILIGTKDEPLAQTAQKNIKKNVEQMYYDAVERVYSSPLIRCMQSAQIIYPDISCIVNDDLRPLDIGELTNMPIYKAKYSKLFDDWADSDTIQPLGGGENPNLFEIRCTKCIREILNTCAEEGVSSIAVFSHRLYINTLLKHFIVPKNVYYNWRIPHGKSYKLYYNTLTNTADLI